MDYKGGGLYTVTIASGEAVSNTINITKIQPRGISIEIPAAWTAADIQPLVSRDRSTWLPLYVTDSDLEAVEIRIKSVPTATACVITADAGNWGVQNYPYFRVVSLTAGADTNAAQGAARTLVIGFTT